MSADTPHEASRLVILVTGSTDGIGLETARALAVLGHRVLLHGRSRERGQAALQDVRRRSGSGRLEYFNADFASFAAVRGLAQAVRARHTRLDVLVNNAGVFMPDRRLTPDGLETTFQVNHLAPFLLTQLLLDLLQSSAPARIVNVSSATHQGTDLDFDNLQGEHHYSGHAAYALSKLANILFTYSLAERLHGTGVTANALHPGGIDTKLLRAGFGGGGRSLQAGVETLVYLATSPEAAQVSGEYFVNKRPMRSSAATYDAGLRQQLWEASDRLIAEVERRQA